MKRILIGFLLLMGGWSPLFAQNFATANLTIAGTAPACLPTACVSLAVSQNVGGATITLSGTWSGTISFYGSGDGGVTLVALTVYPSNSTTGVTTATGNGTWQVNPAGYTNLYAIFTTATSGTVVATIRSSVASARAGGGGGGAGLQGTANAFNCATFMTPSLLGDDNNTNSQCPSIEQSTSIFLQNPAFDSSTSLNPIPGWTTYVAPGGGATPALSYDTSTPHSGKNALVITATSQYTGATTVQNWPVHAGQTYILHAWAKGGGDIAAIAITGWTSGGYVGTGSVCQDFSETYYTTTSTWTQITIYATFTSTCNFMKIQLEDGSASPSGTIEYDDIELLLGDSNSAGLPPVNVAPVTVQANSTSAQTTQTVTIPNLLAGNNAQYGQHLHFETNGVFSTQSLQTPTIHFQLAYGGEFFLSDITSTATLASTSNNPYRLEGDCIQVGGSTQGQLECSSTLCIDLGASAVAGCTQFLSNLTSTVGAGSDFDSGSKVLTMYITFSTQPASVFNALTSRMLIVQGPF